MSHKHTQELVTSQEGVSLTALWYPYTCHKWGGELFNGVMIYISIPFILIYTFSSWEIELQKRRTEQCVYNHSLIESWIETSLIHLDTVNIVNYLYHNYLMSINTDIYIAYTLSCQFQQNHIFAISIFIHNYSTYYVFFFTIHMWMFISILSDISTIKICLNIELKLSVKSKTLELNKILNEKVSNNNISAHFSN